MKKTFITIGSIITTATSVAAVVSCGSSDEKNPGTTTPLNNPGTTTPLNNPGTTPPASTSLVSGYTSNTLVSGKVQTYTNSPVVINESTFEADILRSIAALTTTTPTSAFGMLAAASGLATAGTTTISTINKYWIIDVRINDKVNKRVIFLDTNTGLSSFTYTDQNNLSDRVDPVAGTNTLVANYKVGKYEVKFKGNKGSLKLTLNYNGHEETI